MAAGRPAAGRTGLVIATAMTAVAVPTMLGLGAWQLHRREWKEARLAELARAPYLPPVRVAAPLTPGLNFRSATAAVDCPIQSPDARAGRSPTGESGFALRVRCRADGAPLTLVVGWVPPEGFAAAQSVRVAVRATVTGRLIEDADGYHLYPDIVPADGAPTGARVVAVPPGLDSIPNNHLSYAIQWFSFAAIWAAIFGLWARARVAASRRGG